MQLHFPQHKQDESLIHYRQILSLLTWSNRLIVETLFSQPYLVEFIPIPKNSFQTVHVKQIELSNTKGRTVQFQKLYRLKNSSRRHQTCHPNWSYHPERIRIETQNNHQLQHSSEASSLYVRQSATLLSATQACKRTKLVNYPNLFFTKNSDICLLRHNALL